MLQTFFLLVENKPGALARITGLLSARGYNVETLNVTKAGDTGFSSITFQVVLEEEKGHQLVKHLKNLVNVVQAELISDGFINGDTSQLLNANR